MLPVAPHRLAFIERLQRSAAECRQAYSLAGGLPAESLFPRKTIAHACVRVLGAGDCAALQYGWPEGSLPLREWIAARLRARGAHGTTAEDVVITSGAQQAIALSVDVLTMPGDRVNVDALAYPAALELFRARGLVPTTAREAKVAYVMAGVTNPRGTPPDTVRIRELTDAGAVVIADEAYAELRFDGATVRPLLSDAPERTFHIGTFSKTVCPGFRIGWLVPPRAYKGDVLRLKAGTDLQANSLSQAILEEMIRHWNFDAHLSRAREIYAKRAEALLRAVRRWLPGCRAISPEGGFSVFVETDDDGDDAALLELAARFGTSFDPGSLFHGDSRSSPVAFRLCHSSVPANAMEEAVRRLARALDEFRRTLTPRHIRRP